MLCPVNDASVSLGHGWCLEQFMEAVLLHALGG